MIRMTMRQKNDGFLTGKCGCRGNDVLRIAAGINDVKSLLIR